MKRWNRYPVAILAAVVPTVLALIGGTNLSCWAQQSKQPNSPFLQPTREKTSRKFLKNSNNPELKAQRLKAIVDTPNVPPYSGKTQFVMGTIFPNVKGGPSATMQFSVKDKPTTVLSWYKNALNENKWSMLDNMTGTVGLAAMKDHNICQVMVLAPTKPNCQCDVLLRYKFYKPTNFETN